MKRTLIRILVLLSTSLVAFSIATQAVDKNALAPALAYAAVSGGIVAVIVEIALAWHDIRVMYRRRRVLVTLLLGAVLTLSLSLHTSEILHEIRILGGHHAESA